jgi:peptidoglycan/LPS O-acetylase OafA/YrhL
LLFVTFARFERRKRCVAALLATATLIFVPVPIWESFPIWLMGCGMHFVRRANVLSGKGIRFISASIAIALLLMVLVASRANKLDVWSDFIVGAGFTLLLYVLLHSGPKTRIRYSRGAALIAGFSYSMYAVHFPLVVLARALLWNTGYWQPGIVEVLTGLVMLSAILFLTYLFSLVTESHTDRVRKVLRRPTPPNRVCAVSQTVSE